MKINLTYTVKKNLIPDYYYEVLSCYGLSAKNIKNSSLFIIKNIFNSYTYNKELNTYTLKNNLHQNQLDIIHTVNQTILTLNAKLKSKYEYKLNLYNQLKEKHLNNQNNNKEEFKEKEPKLIQFNEYLSNIDSKTYYQIINKSLLENVIKTKESINKEFVDYGEVHSHLAQAVVQQVCDEYNYYFKALKEYFIQHKDKTINNSENNNFTGMPKEPQYKAKNSKITFELCTERFNNNGTVLIIGNKHKLYKDYAKKELLKPEIIDKFNSFNLMKVINNDLKEKNIHYLNNINNYDIVGIRVIPGKYKKLPKIEYIISFEKELKGFYPDLMNKAQQRYNKDFFELKSNLQLSIIKDYFNNDYKDLNNQLNEDLNNNTSKVNNNNSVPYFMGLDLGVVNFAAVSFYTANRDKNYVISGKTLKSRISQLDNRIDKKKKELCIDTIKLIQSKKDKKEVLTRQELNLLNEYYKSIYNDNLISTTQERKLNITNDYIHKLSKCLIDECIKKNIKVIVVGKNKGWKNEINNGAKNNRDFYNFPHARFIETLKYKALLKDMVVIEIEESYTSKTSFIDNEELRVFNKNKEENLTQGKENQLSKSTIKNSKIKILGRRINRKFITKNGKIIHADINGSFNIVRKVLLNFKYNKETINLSYELMELNMSRKVKLNNFYAQSLIKKQKLKEIKCEQSGVALSF
jgi:IS605 OrfB family transposase